MSTSKRALGCRWAVAILCLALFSSAKAQTVFNNLHSLAFLDGTGPFASLIVSGNTLYGTTHSYGGGDGGGDGSVFRMNLDGSGFTNLHTFSGYAPEGGNLWCRLVLFGGTLYGTATFGGDLDHGCVFAMGTNGLGLTNIYSFSSNSLDSANLDGAYPLAGLLLIGNTLYGTANEGGTNGSGTLFAVNTNGTAFTNLHSFSFTSGNYPSSDLLLSDGTLYGTTPSGGGSGYGTIFKIATNGLNYSNFFDFTALSGPDGTNYEGAFPACNLVGSGTNLYGTAAEGGDFGGGTIFTIDTNGNSFNVLHAFAAADGVTGTNVGGARPKSGLTLIGNVLYGTASLGGSSGSGTIFKINTDGSGFTTLYDFSATSGLGATNSDGAHPIGGLLYSGSTLYGTTSEGGTSGYGTVFRLSAPPTLSLKLSGTNAILTWSSNVIGYSLQATTTLATPGAWDPISGQYSVTNPISTRQKFYRLMRP